MKTIYLCYVMLVVSFSTSKVIHFHSRLEVFIYIYIYFYIYAAKVYGKMSCAVLLNHLSSC